MTHIGEWTRRELGPGVRGSRWHRVESEIEDDVVVHCGKRLRDRIQDGKGLEFTNKPPFDDTCSYCS